MYFTVLSGHDTVQIHLAGHGERRDRLHGFEATRSHVQKHHRRCFSIRHPLYRFISHRDARVQMRERGRTTLRVTGNPAVSLITLRFGLSNIESSSEQYSRTIVQILQ